MMSSNRKRSKAQLTLFDCQAQSSAKRARSDYGSQDGLAHYSEQPLDDDSLDCNREVSSHEMMILLMLKKPVQM